jgi:hypothetical protein
VKFFLFSVFALLTTIPAAQNDKANASPTSSMPQATAKIALQLESTTFEFPGAGKRNNNQTIGDFCCTGETATVRTAQGTPVGYIYFYDFRGGINTKSGAEADQFSVLVSGVSDSARLNAGSIGRAKSSVEFAANEMKPSLSRQVVAGALQFKIIIEDVKFIDEAHTRFWMDSIKIKVEVEEVPAVQPLH